MTFDAIVIGTGQAGPSLIGDLVAAGMNVAVIERLRYGGTCVNNGCIPTKTMVASARAIHMARRGAEFGFKAPGSIASDMKAIKARKDAIVARSNQGIERYLKDLEKCTVYEGHARFVEPHVIEVNGDRLTGLNIFLNVGGRASIPALPGVDSVPFLNNSSMMGVDFLPEHLIVVGGSYIGLEFGQMFRRFGSRVTIVERGPRLISREDEDVSGVIREILEKEGIDVRVESECIRLGRRGDQVEIGMDCAAPEKTVVGSHLLLAVGRRPNTDDLGLEKAGVQTDPRGYVVVDDELRTNVPGVWALGDCNGRGAFTHTSYNDYEVVSENLLRKGSRKVTDRITAYALYIDPPLGRAGMTEADVRRSGGKALIAKRDMADIARAVEMSETQGFLKILVDAETKLILGASVLGVGGDEIIHSILDVMYARAPYTVIERAMHIHPTVTELIPTTLAGLEPLG